MSELSFEARLEELRELMTVAMEVEFSTIPPYATAAYTIGQVGQYAGIMPQDVNAEPLEVIRQVMVEEMLHLTLAGNVLTALGGHVDMPALARRLTYPRRLLPNCPNVVLHLRKFTRDQIRTFKEVERPAPQNGPASGGDCLKAQTIGGFYQCVLKKLVQFCADYPDRQAEIWSGDPAWQIGPEHYWGSGGEVLRVQCLESAVHAIIEIIEEGEGGGLCEADLNWISQHADLSRFTHLGERAGDGDILPGTDDEDIAHFYKFNEILLSRYYRPEDRFGQPPTGGDLIVDWDAVAPMRNDPSPDNPPAEAEVRAKVDAFNGVYTGLVDQLQAAFSGEPDRLRELGPVMVQLRYAAQALVRMPIGDGETAGPNWTYLG